MTLTDSFLAQLEREAAKSRKVLDRVPEGKNDWKPHEKSMPLGYLATVVATMPGWIEMILNLEELDIAPPDGSRYRPQEWTTRTELLASFGESLSKGRTALEKAGEDRILKTNWKLLAGGKVVSDQPRHVVLTEFFSHLSHHRGQLTVYLRLNGEVVPAIFGPSADEAGGFD